MLNAGKTRPTSSSDWHHSRRMKGSSLPAMRRGEFILLLAGAVATWSLVGHAQNLSAGYPDRPITLIVPYAPGGGNDVLARAVAEPMAIALRNVR